MNGCLQFFWILLIPGFAEDRVQRFVLPESRVVPVLVHPLTTTTVRLPETIIGYDGLGFSQDPKDGGEYYLRVLPEEGLVTVGVWTLPSPPRNLQVHLRDDLITLLMIPVEEPGRSLFQLHLLAPVVSSELSPTVEDDSEYETDEGSPARVPVWWESGGIHYRLLELGYEGDSTYNLEVELRNPDSFGRRLLHPDVRLRQGNDQWRVGIRGESDYLLSDQSNQLSLRWPEGQGPLIPDLDQIQLMFLSQPVEMMEEQR